MIKNTVKQEYCEYYYKFKITVLLFQHILRCKCKFKMSKLYFQQPFLQFSVSRDPSENHSNMLIIINVENICAAKYFGENHGTFFSGFFIRLFEIEIFCNNINLFNVILINLLHA